MISLRTALMVILFAAFSGLLAAQGWPAWSNPVLPGDGTPGGSTKVQDDMRAREARAIEIRRLADQLREQRNNEVLLRARLDALRAEHETDGAKGSPLDGLRFSMRGVWGRFDGSHDAIDPEPNRHKVTIDWFRVEFRAGYSFDSHWEVETLIPFDTKRQRASYEDADGHDFDNPVGDIHHRDETRYGLGDFQQWVRWTAHNVLHESISFGIGFGLTIPVGGIERDPYEAGNKGKRHRHIQFGTGTVDPLASVSLRVNHAWWEFSLSLGGTYPAYENRYHYRGAPSGEASLQFRARVTSWFAAQVGLFGLAQGRAFWNSRVDPNSGYTSTGARLGLNFAVTDQFWIFPTAAHIFNTVTPYGSETFRSQFIVSLTFSFAFGASGMGPSIIGS